LLRRIVDAHYLEAEQQASQQYQETGHAEEQERSVLADQAENGIDLANAVPYRVALEGDVVVNADRHLDDLPASGLGLELRRGLEREALSVEAHLVDRTPRKGAIAALAVAET